MQGARFLLVDGRVAGTWTIARAGDTPHVVVALHRRLTAAERDDVMQEGPAWRRSSPTVTRRARCGSVTQWDRATGDLAAPEVLRPVDAVGRPRVGGHTDAHVLRRAVEDVRRCPALSIHRVKVAWAVELPAAMFSEQGVEWPAASIRVAKPVPLRPVWLK